MRNGDYTITKSHSTSSILPYGLHCKNQIIGFFKTSKEAEDKHERLTK
jgi:hypothetical protein